MLSRSARGSSCNLALLHGKSWINVQEEASLAKLSPIVQHREIVLAVGAVNGGGYNVPFPTKIALDRFRRSLNNGVVVDAGGDRCYVYRAIRVQFVVWLLQRGRCRALAIPFCTGLEAHFLLSGSFHGGWVIWRRVVLGLLGFRCLIQSVAEAMRHGNALIW